MFFNKVSGTAATDIDEWIAHEMSHARDFCDGWDDTRDKTGCDKCICAEIKAYSAQRASRFGLRAHSNIANNFPDLYKDNIIGEVVNGGSCDAECDNDKEKKKTAANRKWKGCSLSFDP